MKKKKKGFSTRRRWANLHTELCYKMFEMIIKGHDRDVCRMIVLAFSMKPVEKNKADSLSHKNLNIQI